MDSCGRSVIAPKVTSHLGLTEKPSEVIVLMETSDGILPGFVVGTLEGKIDVALFSPREGILAASSHHLASGGCVLPHTVLCCTQVQLSRDKDWSHEPSAWSRSCGSVLFTGRVTLPSFYTHFLSMHLVPGVRVSMSGQQDGHRSQRALGGTIANSPSPVCVAKKRVIDPLPHSPSIKA